MGGRGSSFGGNITTEESVVNRIFKEKQGDKFVFTSGNDDRRLKEALAFAKENGLTDAEAQAINLYSASMYMDLNQGLWANKMTPELLSMENALNRALDKLKPYEGTVYRGKNLSEERIKKYIDAANKSTTITEIGFTSTSKVKEKAFNENVEFEIKSKRGREITPIAKFGDTEDEVLFISRSKFSVNRVIPKGHGGYKIVMEEI